MARVPYGTAVGERPEGLLAILASGQNPDLTPYALPVDASGGSAPGGVQKVNAGFMAAGQTAKQYVGKLLTSTTLVTTQPFEVVTAGKTFFMTDLFVTSDAASSATIDVRLQAAGVDIFRAGVHSLSPISLPGIETQPFGSSGQQVSLVLPATPAAQSVWFNVLGFEQ